MAQGFGYNEFALVGKETTWGTAAASFPVTLELVEDGLAAIREKAFSGSFRSRSKRHVVRAKEGAAGAIGVELAYTNMEGLLKHAFGAVASSVASGETVVYDHVFTLADALQTGLTVQINRDVVATSNKGFQYVGCRVNSLTLALEADGILKVTLDLITKDEAVDIAMTAGTFPSDFITFDQLTEFNINASDKKAKVKSFELTIGNGLDGDRRSIGNRNILAPLPGDHREITGSVEMWFEDMNEYNDFVTPADRKIDFTLEGASIGVAEKKRLKVEIFRCVFTGETPKVDSAGALSQTLSFEALYDESGAQDVVKATLTNLTTDTGTTLL